MSMNNWTCLRCKFHQAPQFRPNRQVWMSYMNMCLKADRLMRRRISGIPDWCPGFEEREEIPDE